MAQVKKLSIAKVFGKVTAALLMVAGADGKVVPNPTPVRLMRIGGVATGTKTGVGDYGPWECLTGEFVAYSAKDGEEQRAPYAFLPDVALIPITVALKATPGASVQFLIDVFAKHSTESATGYEYTFEPVVKPQGEDPIARLLAQAAPMLIGDKMVGGTLAIGAPAEPGHGAVASTPEIVATEKIGKKK